MPFTTSPAFWIPPLPLPFFPSVPLRREIAVSFLFLACYFLIGGSNQRIAKSISATKAIPAAAGAGKKRMQQAVKPDWR